MKYKLNQRHIPARRLDYNQFCVNPINSNLTLNRRRKNNYEWILYRCLFGNVEPPFVKPRQNDVNTMLSTYQHIFYQILT